MPAALQPVLAIQQRPFYTVCFLYNTVVLSPTIRHVCLALVFCSCLSSAALCWRTSATMTLQQPGQWPWTTSWSTSGAQQRSESEVAACAARLTTALRRADYRAQTLLTGLPSANATAVLHADACALHAHGSGLGQTCVCAVLCTCRPPELMDLSSPWPPSEHLLAAVSPRSGR